MRGIQRVNLKAWKQTANLAPPVCNALLHRDHLTVMAVGGPNSRHDFHLNHGAEFFWQHEQTLSLPTVQRRERRDVLIEPGHVFLLPPRIPHSPQRPAHSFGLVVERERTERELDALRWYVDFERPEAVLWEKEFRCTDLGRDLLPIIEDFRRSDAARTGVPSTSGPSPLEQDHETLAPAPLALRDWLADHAASLSRGCELLLFGEALSSDMRVSVLGGALDARVADNNRTVWFYQLRGDGRIYTPGVDADSGPSNLSEGSSFMIPCGKPYGLQVERGGLMLSVRVASEEDDPIRNAA